MPPTRGAESARTEMRGCVAHEVVGVGRRSLEQRARGRRLRAREHANGERSDARVVAAEERRQRGDRNAPRGRGCAVANPEQQSRGRRVGAREQCVDTRQREQRRDDAAVADRRGRERAFAQLALLQPVRRGFATRIRSQLEHGGLVHLVVVDIGIRAFKLDPPHEMRRGTVPQLQVNRVRVRTRARDQQLRAGRSFGAIAALAGEDVRRDDVHLERKRIGGMPAVAHAHRTGGKGRELEQVPEHLASHLAPRGPRQYRAASRGEQVALGEALTAAQPRPESCAVRLRYRGAGVQRRDDAVVAGAVALHAHEHTIAIGAHDEQVRHPLVTPLAHERRAERLVARARRAIHRAPIDLLAEALAIHEMVASAKIVTPRRRAIRRPRARGAAEKRQPHQAPHSPTPSRRICPRARALPLLAAWDPRRSVSIRDV